MRRALAVVALAALVALLHAPEVRAGAGQARRGARRQNQRAGESARPS